MTTITGNPRTPPDSSASPCLHKSHLTEYVGNTFIPDFRMTIHDFFIQKAEHMLRNTTKSVAAIRDTLIIRDTVPLLRQKVEMVTPHIHFSGLIEENRLKGDIKIPVTLNQAVWVEYKGWWFWKRVKAIRQAISSNNPHVEIRYSEYIKIDKK